MYDVSSLIVTAIILPLLGVVAVYLRLLIRLRLTDTFVGIDDWMIAFGCLLVCAQGAIQIVGTLLFCSSSRHCGARYSSAHAILLGREQS